MTYNTIRQKDSNSNLSGRYQHRTLWWLQTLAELDRKSSRAHFIVFLWCMPEDNPTAVLEFADTSRVFLCVRISCFGLPLCSHALGRQVEVRAGSTSAGHSGLLHTATPVIRHYQPFSPVQWAFLPLLSNLMKPNRLQNSRKSLARFHNDLILLCSYKFSFSFKRKKKKLRCYFEKRFLLKTTLPKRTIAFHNVLPGKPIIFHL